MTTSTIGAGLSDTLPVPGQWGPRDPRLDPIREKSLRGERLSMDEGRVLYDTPDIWGLCELADAVRRRMHGEATYYNINRHINYSNVCALSCKFCAFHRKRGQEGAYEMMNFQDYTAMMEAHQGPAAPAAPAPPGNR